MKRQKHSARDAGRRPPAAPVVRKRRGPRGGRPVRYFTAGTYIGAEHEELANIREYLGWSVARFARAIGQSRGWVVAAEAGEVGVWDRQLDRARDLLRGYRHLWRVTKWGKPSVRYGLARALDRGETAGMIPLDATPTERRRRRRVARMVADWTAAAAALDARIRKRRDFEDWP